MTGIDAREGRVAEVRIGIVTSQLGSTRLSRGCSVQMLGSFRKRELNPIYFVRKATPFLPFRIRHLAPL